jgi:DNA-binding transcriptional regulator YiaG
MTKTETLRAIREETGLTTSEIADMLGVSCNTVRIWVSNCNRPYGDIPDHKLQLLKLLIKEG